MEAVFQLLGQCSLPREVLLEALLLILRSIS